MKIIVAGTAGRADQLGEKYVKENSISLIEMHVLFFWDGTSKGSKHMINLAKEYKLKLKIVKY